MHVVPLPSQMEDGESPFPAHPGAPAPLLPGVRTVAEAAAFACGFGGLWSYSRALSSLWVRRERCLSSVIAGGWKTGEEVFLSFISPICQRGSVLCLQTEDRNGRSGFIWEIKLSLSIQSFFFSPFPSYSLFI